jgi:hypothetical protein
MSLETDEFCPIPLVAKNKATQLAQHIYRMAAHMAAKL